MYYPIRDDVFYYSSLMRPLEELCGELKINDRWVADYIGQDNLNAFTEAEETPVLGIYRTAPAGFLKITQKDIKKRCYWQPYQKKKKQCIKVIRSIKSIFWICTENVQPVFCVLRGNSRFIKRRL
ncbi:hypothetical protein LC724_29845 [Blautia sp. RD014234]|nr:hypothetical protein [Blautia parvula]